MKGVRGSFPVAWSFLQCSVQRRSLDATLSLLSTRRLGSWRGSQGAAQRFLRGEGSFAASPKTLATHQRLSVARGETGVWVNCALSEHFATPSCSQGGLNLSPGQVYYFCFSHPKVDPDLVSAWQAPHWNLQPESFFVFPVRRRHASPPATGLLTGEGLSPVAGVDGDTPRTIAPGDNTDACRWLACYFCLPAVTAKDIGLR